MVCTLQVYKFTCPDSVCSCSIPTQQRFLLVCLRFHPAQMAWFLSISDRMLLYWAALSVTRSSLLRASSKLSIEPRPSSHEWNSNTWVRQIGQVECNVTIHISMQVMWNAWEQSGRNFTHSPSSNSPKQTAHSVFFNCRFFSSSSSRSWMTGRDCTLEWSSPWLWNWG